MKTFTPEDLAIANGENDKPTYVSVKGKVYDLSESKKWIKGRHMKRHQAGCDLTSDLSAAPHGPDVLDRFPLIGEVAPAENAAYSGIRAKIEGLLDKYPFFRRHPHPALVHFPVALFLVAAIFEVIAIYFGSERTEWAAMCCALAAAVSMPPVIVTGYFAWWINYDCGKSKIIFYKRILGWLTLIVAIIAMVIRYGVQDPLNLNEPFVLLYMGCLIALAVLASIVGFLGGKLSFPY